jgi:tetratricopeptide (TPR) repeat protein
MGEIYQDIGSQLARKGKYAEAEWYYREAIRLSPYLLSCDNDFDVLLRGFRRSPEGEEVLKKLVETEPSSALGHRCLGELYILMGRKEDARKELQEARDLYKTRGEDQDANEIDEVLKKL